MNIIAVIAVSGLVAYGPPENRAALEAVQMRVINYWALGGKQVNIYDYRPEGEFPFDVILEQCQRRAHWPVRTLEGSMLNLSGYECMLEIWPNAFPAFRARGFFYFNGEKWIYYGTFYPSANPPRISVFDSAEDEGELILKDGSQTYEGQPNSPYYDNYDPYQKLFDLEDKYDSPN